MVSRTYKLKKINLIKDTTGFEYISRKKGGNPGGVYQSPSNVKYIVKIMDDEHIFNEILASYMYKLLNIPVPDLYVGTNFTFSNDNIKKLETKNGVKLPADLKVQNVLLGKWIDGLKKVNFDIAYKAKAGYIYGAGADMWLSNHDVIGPGRDNLLRGPNGMLIRIDVGGSMFMRARTNSGKKTFNNTNVPEVNSYKNEDITKVISRALAPYSAEQLRDSLARVAELKNKQIKTTVMNVWNSTNQVLDIPKSLAIAYVDVLIKRKNIIASKLATMNNIGVTNKNVNSIE